MNCVNDGSAYSQYLCKYSFMEHSGTLWDLVQIYNVYAGALGKVYIAF